jgi:hypothetical protein
MSVFAPRGHLKILPWTLALSACVAAAQEHNAAEMSIRHVTPNFVLRVPRCRCPCLLLPLQVLAQSHSGFPVDIIAGPAPQPFMSDARERLLYELHLTN